MGSFEFLVKVGDQTHKNRGYKDGMFHRCKPSGYNWGSGTRTRHLIVRIDNIEEAEAKEICSPPPQYYNKENSVRFLSSKYIDLKEVENQYGVKVSDMRSRDTITDIVTISPTLLKPIEEYPFGKEFVHGSISSGTYIIDNVGGLPNYQYLSDAIADLANLTGNLNLDVQVSHTDDAICQPGISLGTYTLKIYSSSSYRHIGYPNHSHAIITANPSAQNYFYNNCEGSGGNGKIHLIDLDLRAVTQYQPQYNIINSNYIDNAHTLLIENCIIKGGGSGGSGQNIIANSDSSLTLRIIGNLLYNSPAMGITTSSGCPFTAENNTIYGCVDHGIDAVSTSSTITNNFVANCGNANYEGIASSAGNSNYSDDTTGGNAGFASGSGNITSGTVANDVASTTETDTNFLYVKDSSSALYNAGAAVTYYTTDLAHTTVTGTPDIGCHELAEVTSISINVNDTLGVADNVSIQEDIVLLTTSDSLAVSDVVTITESSVLLSVYDSVGITENVSIVESDLLINTNETIQVTEDVQINSQLPPISVFDNVEISESIEIAETSLLITVEDSISIAEDIAISETDLIVDTNDSISISEDITATIPVDGVLSISASDNLSIAEYIDSVISSLEINSNDTLSISESVSGGLSACVIDTNDSISFTEDAQCIVSDIIISVNDALSISEDISGTISTTGDISISVNENILFTENILGATSYHTISINDNLTLSESVTIICQGITINEILYGISEVTRTFTATSEVTRTLTATSKVDG